MCGRYRIKDTDELTDFLRATFGIPDWVRDGNASRYNIAPSQNCPTVLVSEAAPAAIALMRWGFVPFWEKAAKPRLAPINAQAETVATGRMFAAALQRRRCLVPADGFYEWRRLDGRAKQPFDIQLKGGRPFVMAGIYERATAVRPATFAILTTRANELMASIHRRMPVILDRGAAHRWLDGAALDAEAVATLATPYPASEMEARPISGLVNSPVNDGPEILATPVAPPLPRAAEPKQEYLF